MNPLIVAIDGPSGAGKGTVAKAVAARLRYRHIDTGAMYRALAWRALREPVDLDDGHAVAALATRVRFSLEQGRVEIDGRDVAGLIRTPEIDIAAARIARLPPVRAVLVERQREYGRGGGIVMEGRDIGTVVFPHADVKVYLDASPAERARRRAADPAHAGGTGTAVAEVASALEARDLSDRTRAVSPLAVAPDAIVIDTTELPVDQVVDRVVEIVADRLSARRSSNGPG